MPCRVLIVEDEEMPRQLFEIFVKADDRFTLSSSISNAALAPDLCRAGKVDLILMDVCTVLGESGLEAAAIIKKEFPEIRIIIVTSMPEYSFLARAKEAGVDSFWYKEANKEHILAVMERTMRGERVWPDQTPTVLFGAATNHDLTDRELQVLRELPTGESNAEIAEKLCISAGTVKRHVENMLAKTGFHTRTELVAEACRLGIVLKDF